VEKGNKILVAFWESNGYSSSTLNQEDARAFWLKLIIQFLSDDNSANYFSRPDISVLQQKALKSNRNSHMVLLEMSIKHFQMLLNVHLIAKSFQLRITAVIFCGIVFVRLFSHLHWPSVQSPQTPVWETLAWRISATCTFQIYTSSRHMIVGNFETQQFQEHLGHISKQ